ncbi:MULTISPECIES: DinB family protein [Niastella]|uniref:DinB family protein n=1 Tax=Niastella soli TaxID=2821487 RepID=A0ABS3YN69_9BACT|nr:DinB family protein [Niastella soli]MBO9199342.1 DinB family protein [Niastella soli]
MKTATALLQEFESATNAYLDIVSGLSQDEINTVPFLGSWTAAQVTEHLCKSDEGMLMALNGPVYPTNRPVDAGVNNLRSIFLDFTTKLQSPDFIIPGEEPHDKDSLINTFKAGREQIGKAIETLDLTTSCHMPIFGEPTRLELIYFVIFHTQRHTNQVKHINEKLVGV